MVQNYFNLKGKTALITGGSRGLGREIALAYATAGADVVIVSRKIEACELIAEEIRQLGRKAFAYSCHVGRWDELQKLVDQVYKEVGNIDILVNNAGMSPVYDKISDISEKMWDSVFSLNIKGPFRLSILIGEKMVEAGGGAILNISSIAAVQPTPKEIPYAMAKAGLNNMTISLAEVFSPTVRVNTIMAGPFLTDVSKAWDMDAVMKKFEKQSLLRRPGNPDEIVGAALYFVSSASSFTTGSILTVDGGLKR